MTYQSNKNNNNNENKTSNPRALAEVPIPSVIGETLVFQMLVVIHKKKIILSLEIFAVAVIPHRLTVRSRFFKKNF